MRKNNNFFPKMQSINYLTEKDKKNKNQSHFLTHNSKHKKYHHNNLNFQRLPREGLYSLGSLGKEKRRLIEPGKRGFLKQNESQNLNHSIVLEKGVRKRGKKKKKKKKKRYRQESDINNDRRI